MAADAETTPLDVKPSSPKVIVRVPKDSGYAWICLVCSFFVFFLGPGSLKSYGVILVELKSNVYPGVPHHMVFWPLALAVSLGFGMSPIVTGLAMRYGSRPLVLISGVLGCLQYVISAFAPNAEWFLVTFGILGALFLGLCYSTSILAISEYFEKRRAFANGIAIAGSGIGNFVLPPLFRFLFKECGYRNGMIIIGGIMLHVCVCGALMRPISFYTKTIKQAEHTELKSPIYRTPQPSKARASMRRGLLEQSKRSKSLEFFAEDGVREARAASFGESDRENLRQQQQEQQNGSVNRITTLSTLGGIAMVSTQSIPDAIRDAKAAANFDNADISKKKTCSEKLHDFWYLPGPGGIKRPMINFSLFCNLHFMVFFLAAVLPMGGYNSIFPAVPAHVDDVGLSKGQGAFAISLLGIMDLVGRIIFGYIFDLKFIKDKKKIAYTINLVIAFVLAFIIAFTTGYVSISVFASLFGFFGGTFIPLIPVLIVEGMGQAMLPNAYGLILFGQGVASFSILLLGVMYGATGVMKYGFFYIGSTMLVGGLVILLEPCARRWQHRNTPDNSVLIRC